MKMYMASFTKLWTHETLSAILNEWKLFWRRFIVVMKVIDFLIFFVWLKIWKFAHFIKSQEPLQSCHLIWKVAMHSWKNTIWKMFKNQKKSYTGSLGTGSDTGRTRFLVNFITRNSKIIRRNRFPYRYNSVPGTNSREVIFEQVWNSVPL